MAVGDVMRQRLGHRTGARRRGGVTAEDAEAAYRGAMRMGGLRVVGPDGRPARDAASVDAAVRAVARPRRRVFGRARGHALHGETSRVAVRRVGSAQTADWGASHRSARGVVLRDGRALFAVRSSVGDVRGVRAEGRAGADAGGAHPESDVRTSNLLARGAKLRRGARGAGRARGALPDVDSVFAHVRTRAPGVRSATLESPAARGGRRRVRHRAHDSRSVPVLGHATGARASQRRGRGERGVFPPESGGGGAWRTAPRRGGCESCATRRDESEGRGRGPWRWDGVSRTNSSRCWTGAEWMSRGSPTGADRTRTEAREGSKGSRRRSARGHAETRNAGVHDTKGETFLRRRGKREEGRLLPDRGVEALVGHDRRADRRRVIQDETMHAWRAPRLASARKWRLVSGIEALRFSRVVDRSTARVVFVRGGAFRPRRVRRRARADNDARGEALARVVSRAERSSRSLRAGVGRPLHLRVETSGWYASLGRVRRLARTPRRLRHVEGASPGPHARGRKSRASPRYRRRVSSSRSAVRPSPARALARRRRGPRGVARPAITRSFIWIVLPLFLLCHACFCGCDTANDDRVVSRTFAQEPQRRRRRRDRRRHDRPDDPRRRADADDDEDDYDPEYAFEAGRRRQPRAPPIDDVDDDGGVPPADLFAVAALPRRVAPFPAAAAVVDDARGGRDFATDTCAICCEDVEGGQTLCALPCGHAFHDESARVRVARDSRELSDVSSVRAERRAGRGGEVRRAGRTSGRGEGG